MRKKLDIYLMNSFILFFLLETTPWSRGTTFVKDWNRGEYLPGRRCCYSASGTVTAPLCIKGAALRSPLKSLGTSATPEYKPN